MHDRVVFQSNPIQFSLFKSGNVTHTHT